MYKPVLAAAGISTAVKRLMGSSLAVLLATAACLQFNPAYAADLPAFNSLPDWSGTWATRGGTAFDRATWTLNGVPADPGNSASGVDTAGTRAHPPYTPEWEAIYTQNLALRDKGRFPDPLTSCIAHGFPRIFNVNWPVEFVVRPEQVWILAEHTRSTMRIYTDGSAHPAPDVIWHNLVGDSVGHWEGDTLVFTTVGIKGWSDKDSILDRSGLVLSEEAHATTRIHRTREKNAEGVMEDLLLVQLTLEDPKALTRPWVVEKRFWQLPPRTRIMDYECNENNRVVVDQEGRSLFLDAKGKAVK